MAVAATAATTVVSFAAISGRPFVVRGSGKEVVVICPSSGYGLVVTRGASKKWLSNVLMLSRDQHAMHRSAATMLAKRRVGVMRNTRGWRALSGAISELRPERETVGSRDARRAVNSGSSWDVVVVGGGHAGCEAAAAAARLGARTLLLTHKLRDLGTLSCNPSIGGVGKGHLVREIDALGGVMGRVADAAGIQFRVLNASKGPAVRGPRAQMDRTLYKEAMLKEMQSLPNLQIALGSVEDLLICERGAVRGVKIGAVTDSEGGLDSWHVLTERLVITTGTFLRGVIHCGTERVAAGRAGDDAATVLADTLKRIGFKTGRLKTGTPPRIRASSVDTSTLDVQEGDDPPRPFSFMHLQPHIGNKIMCWSTRTVPRTHDIVREHKHLSPTFEGAEGAGNGPRYCPSLDTKVARFPERTHLVWLEPEGLAGKHPGKCVCICIRVQAGRQTDRHLRTDE